MARDSRSDQANTPADWEMFPDGRIAMMGNSRLREEATSYLSGLAEGPIENCVMGGDDIQGLACRCSAPRGQWGAFPPLCPGAAGTEILELRAY